MDSRLGWLMIATLVLGCSSGGAGGGVAESPTVPTREPATEPEPAPEPSAPSPSACVMLGLGLDLRALATHTGPSGVDMFVLGQADDLRRVTRGAPPRIQHIPGSGVLYAFFDGPREADELARCDEARELYLAEAPLLPIIMQPVANVTEPCQPCP